MKNNSVNTKSESRLVEVNWYQHGHDYDLVKTVTIHDVIGIKVGGEGKHGVADKSAMVGLEVAPRI